MKTQYTSEELDNHALRDLIIDAGFAAQQAEDGPYYTDRGITRESLLAYATKCREAASKLQGGGAHKAVIGGAV